MPDAPLPNQTDEEWIKEAIPYLIKEGYPQQQAIAIAYSMLKGFRDKERSKDDSVQKRGRG